MPIVLRLDIDKPYGRATLPSKLMSKVREDYFFPAFKAFGYLKDLAAFLIFLNENSIPAISYHRICTSPSEEIKNLLIRGNHKIGLHAENTRSLATFSAELDLFKQLNSDISLHSFTKHGSGELKLGRHHYPPYEPEKYHVWAKEVKLPFLFGNGIAESPSSFRANLNFWPDMFWLEPGYQNDNLNTVDKALDVAESGHLILIIHPENLRAISQVKNSFLEIIKKSRERKIVFTVDL